MHAHEQLPRGVPHRVVRCTASARLLRRRGEEASIEPEIPRKKRNQTPRGQERILVWIEVAGHKPTPISDCGGLRLWAAWLRQLANGLDWPRGVMLCVFARICEVLVVLHGHVLLAEAVVTIVVD